RRHARACDADSRRSSSAAWRLPGSRTRDRRPLQRSARLPEPAGAWHGAFLGASSAVSSGSASASRSTSTATDTRALPRGPGAARFKRWHVTQQNGEAAVWSGASGNLIREWDGEWPDALFGHWVLPVPDLSGDGLADVIIAAPHAVVGDRPGGIVVARSPKTG